MRDDTSFCICHLWRVIYVVEAIGARVGARVGAGGEQRE